MMTNRFFFALALAFALAIPAMAATLPFRSGEILAAQLSTQKPSIANEDPQAFVLDFDKKIYARLVVKLAPGRGISIHDYALKAFGRTYPCIAVSTGNGVYNAEKWQFAPADAKEKYTLLFVLDGTKVGFAPVENLTLVCQAPPKERAEQKVDFNLLGNKPFASPGSISNSGIMKAAE